MKKILLSFVLLFMFVFATRAQIVYTFTNCAATGNQGPTQTQVNSAYVGTTLEGVVSINTQGIQEWTVPASDTYHIEVFGAAGGGTSPGLGASMSGDFDLSGGEVLKIVVGQTGVQETYQRTYFAGGGGGGSFVVSASDVPYIIAGGGGGCSADQSGHDAITATSDGNTGTDGNGGTPGEGGSGAGFIGNGAIGMHGGDIAANSFINNAVGGTGSPSGGQGYGGFGGGGGDGYADGGGGGYSGGNEPGEPNGAYGGGSFNSGTNQVNTAGVNSGHGYVIITRLCDPVSVEVTPGTTVCPGAMVTLSGTSSNGGTISWDNGVQNGVAFEINNTTTFNYTSSSPDDCPGSITITVEDNDPPVTPTLDDVMAECAVEVYTPTTTDACAGDIQGTTGTVFPITTQGTTVVTWTFDDGNGNSIDVDQNVIIDDITAPVPDISNIDILAECSVDLTTYTPTATDNCEGTIVGSTMDPLLYTEQGTYTVTWYYDDGNDNIESQIQTIIISDVTDPEIVCPDPAVFQADEFSCDVQLSQTIVYDITYSNTINMEQGGPYCNGTEDVWACETVAGFSWESTGADVPESVSIEYYQSWNNSGTYTTTFNGVYESQYPGVYGECENHLITHDLSPTDYIPGDVNTIMFDIPVDYCIVWDLNPDWNENVFARVTVVYSEGESLEPPLVSDNCEVASVTNDAPAVLPFGETMVTWTVTDVAGNTASCQQTVTVEDVTNPIPDAMSLPELNDECAIEEPEAPTATDACMGSITGVADKNFPYTTQGTYTITWSFDDGNGNVSTQAQIVMIEDVTMPTITCADDVVIDLSVGQTAYTVSGGEFDPVAVDDNCDITDVSNDYNMMSTLDGEDFPPGTYTVTWTVEDAGGNTEYCMVNVVINAYVGISDNTIPNVSVYPNPATNKLNIASEDEVNVIITDINGKVLSSFKHSDEISEIDISDFAAGIYFVKFTSKTGRSVLRFVKQ